MTQGATRSRTIEHVLNKHIELNNWAMTFFTVRAQRPIKLQPQPKARAPRARDRGGSVYNGNKG